MRRSATEAYAAPWQIGADPTDAPTGGRELTAEERLALAVLHQAVFDLTSGVVSATTYDDARDFVFDRRRDLLPYSFTELCSHLGINVSWARGAIREKSSRRFRGSHDNRGASVA